MKPFRQVIIIGMMFSTLVWGGATAFMVYRQVHEPQVAIPSELEKLRHIFYQTLESQTNALTHEASKDELAEFVQKAETSRFYSKKLELKLKQIMKQHQMHIVSLISPSGETIIRGSNNEFRGDNLYFRNYNEGAKPAGRLGDLFQLALNGRTISSVELLPKEVLDREYGKAQYEGNLWYRFPLSEIAEMIYLDLNGNPLTFSGNSRETRGLAHLSIIPVRENDQTIAVLIGARLLSRDRQLLYQYHRLAKNGDLHPTISVDSLRIATTLPVDRGPLKGRPALNTFISEDQVPTLRLPIMNYYGNMVGSLRLESPPTNWVKAPPTSLIATATHTNNPSTALAAQEYQGSEFPWATLCFLLLAVLLGLFSLILVVTVGKECFLAIGNAMKRKKYLSYVKEEGARLRQQKRLRVLRREVADLKETMTISHTDYGVCVPDITDKEIEDITSFVL